MGRIITIIFSIAILGGIVSMCSTPGSVKKQAQLKIQIIDKYHLSPNINIEFGDFGSIPRGGKSYEDYFYAQWIDKNRKEYRPIRCTYYTTYDDKKAFYRIFSCEDKPFRPYQP